MDKKLITAEDFTAVRRGVSTMPRNTVATALRRIAALVDDSKLHGQKVKVKNSPEEVKVELTFSFKRVPKSASVDAYANIEVARRNVKQAALEAELLTSKPPLILNKEEDKRKIGKVAELAAGYSGTIRAKPPACPPVTVKLRKSKA